MTIAAGGANNAHLANLFTNEASKVAGKWLLTSMDATAVDTKKDSRGAQEKFSQTEESRTMLKMQYIPVYECVQSRVKGGIITVRSPQTGISHSGIDDLQIIIAHQYEESIQSQQANRATCERMS